jgi:hypothetical protein
MMGSPIDINQDEDFRALVRSSGLTFLKLSQLLTQRQFPRENQLPDANGDFSLPIDI